MFEQIMRIRVWLSGVDSWMFYSRERELLNESGNLGDLIIRHVVWDRDYDRDLILSNKEQKEIFSNSWPKITITNYYLNAIEVNKFFKSDFMQIDSMVREGINLKKRNNKTNDLSWNDLELMRLFDWGQVKST